MKSYRLTIVTALLLTAAVTLSFGTTAWAAAQKPKLKLSISMAKEVRSQKDGKEVIEAVPTEKAGSGDTIIYTITYTNEGKSAAKDANIVDPVPQHTVYVLESAQGADTDISLSVDGGKSYHPYPVMVTAKDKSRKTAQAPAPAEAYTHVRWVVKKEIQPGGSGQASFKVKVK